MSIQAPDVEVCERSCLPMAAPEMIGFSSERLARMDRAMQTEIDAGH